MERCILPWHFAFSVSVLSRADGRVASSSRSGSFAYSLNIDSAAKTSQITIPGFGYNSGIQRNDRVVLFLH
jgi:hypothetical protein